MQERAEDPCKIGADKPYRATHPQAGDTWKRISALKSAIIGHWDGPHEGLRICCFKFAQRVIATQMVGAKDPRLADKLDTSLLLVPPGHPLLREPELKAEAQGLLDRMCFTLTDQPTYVFLFVNTRLTVQYPWHSNSLH